LPKAPVATPAFGTGRPGAILGRAFTTDSTSIRCGVTPRGAEYGHRGLRTVLSELGDPSQHLTATDV